MDTIINPYRYLVEEIAKRIHDALINLGYKVSVKEILNLLEEPPLEKFGDLSLPTFRLAKQLNIEPPRLALNIAKNLSKDNLIFDVKCVRGYMNIFLNYPELARITLNSIKTLGLKYGHVPTSEKKKIVVEHTSANPIHPLHIGHARNTVIGDTLARLLKARGHDVETRFYIDDVGRQVAILVYGYMLLGKPEPPKDMKVDHWLGLIYAMTNTIIEIYDLKKKIEEAKEKENLEEYHKLVRQLDELMAVAAELRSKNPKMFDKLAQELRNKNHEVDIHRIMTSYENRADEGIVEVTRKITSLCLEGFKETLSRLGIRFDKWDWESDVVWSSLVKKIINRAKSTPYFTIHKGVPALDLPKLKNEELYEKLRIPKTFEIPPLILQRSDGTTLYPTRDIAYSIFKFQDSGADVVINVIGADQKLPQAQLRLALYALGYIREAQNLIHYSYEIVHIPGVKMSSRLGKMITLDEIINEAIKRAKEEVEKRTTLTNEVEKRKVIEAVGLGAIRYFLISIASSKPVVFEWDKVLDFEKNSAPYIQYTHARACGILRKYVEVYGSIRWNEIAYEKVNTNPNRKRIVKLLAKYPQVIAKAADELTPELIPEYLNKLADIFNSWYQEEPVIREQDSGERNLKAAIVYGVKTVIASALNLLGIEAPERM